MKKTIFLLSLLALLLAAACGGTAAEPAAQPAAETAMADPTDEAMMDETMTEADGDEMMDEGKADEAMADGHDDDMMDEGTADEAMADDHSDEMMDEGQTEEAMAEEHGDDMMDDDHSGQMMAELPAWQTMTLVNAITGESFTLADLAGKTVVVEPMATWCTNCRRQLGNLQEAQAQLGDDVAYVALSVETTLSASDLAAYAQETGFNFTFAVLTPELLQALAAEFGQTIANPPSTPHFIIRPDGSFTSLTTGFESADELVAKIQG